jgi:uroporphyrinogen decarboxylase
MAQDEISSRERVLTALSHKTPDRVPVDFLATTEIWDQLADSMKVDYSDIPETGYFDPKWEAVLRHLGIDCRVVSYDQFFSPPESFLTKNAVKNYWNVLSRSTPSRMWRQQTPDGQLYDLWGRHFKIAENPTGAYEELASWPLGSAQSVNDLRSYRWPEPDYWDFSPLPELFSVMDSEQEYHIRFRIGSVFEVAWQLRGMQEFMMDLAINPEIPEYIMDRLTETYVENTRRVLDLAGDRIDMVYFYDDVASQESLLISPGMWKKHIRPRHQKIIDVAKVYDMPVLYHCDGAIYPLIPQLIDMGIDVLNPIQADAAGMDLQNLKNQFGDRLSFHGGIDIIKTLPTGNVQDVQDEVRSRIQILGKDGGYILASSHHIQSDTPIENVLAMYDLKLR